MRRGFARRSIRAVISSLALVLSIALPAAAQSESSSIFALICASSIGFGDLDRTQCGQSVVGGGGDEEPRKEAIGLESFVANALAGNLLASRVLGVAYTNDVALPLVRLNSDPCDAFLASGGADCTTTQGPRGVPTFGASSLNDVLTDEQEALLGCGPFWGTDCETDGIDLLNAEASVLLQSWPGFEGTVAGARWVNGQMVVLPGARGLGQPGYVPTVDGCTAADVDPRCDLAQPLVTPTNAFANEMAALSWNFLMTLVAFSQAPTGEAPASDDFDPLDPTRTGEGQCSFAQPQYCASVVAYLESVPEPDALGAGLAALGVVALLGRFVRLE